MLGSLEEAVTAQEIGNSLTPYRPNVPGWEYIASGCYRHVYRAPSGVVYKVVCSDWYSYESNPNQVELDLLTEHRDKVWAPKVYGWFINEQPVVAMEYVDGYHAPWSYEIDELELTEAQRELVRDAEQFIGDLHGENVMIVDHFTIKVVDAGMTSSSYARAV